MVRNMGTKLPRERAVLKSEARNPNSETNPNVPNSKVFSWFAVFELLKFEFVSDFDIRISDLLIPQSFLAPAWPGWEAGKSALVLCPVAELVRFLEAV
jgi:hypothetical protein